MFREVCLSVCIIYRKTEGADSYAKSKKCDGVVSKTVHTGLHDQQIHWEGRSLLLGYSLEEST